MNEPMRRSQSVPARKMLQPSVKRKTMQKPLHLSLQPKSLCRQIRVWALRSRLVHGIRTIVIWMLKTVALLAIALVMKISLAIFVLTTPASSVCNVRLVRFLLRRHAYATNSKPGVIIARRYIVGTPMHFVG